MRRRFSRSAEGGDWNIDLEFKPEVERAAKPPVVTPVLLTAREPIHMGVGEVDMKEYYKSAMRTAIKQGGWYQGRQISVPWLKMILAGLEMRPVPPEAMWETQGTSLSPTRSGVPAYDDLFPSERGPGSV